jgi:hypothetical protein
MFSTTRLITRLVAAFGVALWAVVLLACAQPSLQGQGEDAYPSAAWQSRIELRQGFELISPVLELSAGSRQEIGIAFKRQEAKLSTPEFFCMTRSALDPLRQVEKACSHPYPGLAVSLSVLNAQGQTVLQRRYDSLTEDAPNQTTALSRQLGLLGTSGLPAGSYRVKLQVLRDFPQLQVTEPHLVFTEAFFKR